MRHRVRCLIFMISMIIIDDATLRKIQMIQLEMLQEVDRICKKCNIHYNIIAGTLLGAIRHGGYIPWDDDADVAMLRFEYEKFRKALLRFLPMVALRRLCSSPLIHQYQH